MTAHRPCSPLAVRQGAAGSGVRGLSQPLDDSGVGHPAALAHGLQSVANAALFESVDECRHDAGPAGAQRVADGDSSAVDIRLGQVRAGVMSPREDDRGNASYPLALHTGFGRVIADVIEPQGFTSITTLPIGPSARRSKACGNCSNGNARSTRGRAPERANMPRRSCQPARCCSGV